ncbi:MAG: hypothetical protein N2235_08810 [Fischerella sp.]|nr:hypothetical protein [Fischerella sp.]
MKALTKVEAERLKEREFDAVLRHGNFAGICSGSKDIVELTFKGIVFCFCLALSFDFC